MKPKLYLPGINGMEGKLMRTMQTLISGGDVGIYRSMNELRGRLRTPHGDVGIAVLYAATDADLMEVVGIGDILGALRVVLVLPDNRLDALEKANLLRPRFIASLESDMKYLGVILRRMIDLYSLTHRTTNRQG